MILTSQPDGMGTAQRYGPLPDDVAKDADLRIESQRDGVQLLRSHADVPPVETIGAARFRLPGFAAAVLAVAIAAGAAAVAGRLVGTNRKAARVQTLVMR